MAITTKLQTKYTIRAVGMIIVCLVLGLWGVYDYLHKIPLKQRIFERHEVCRLVTDALKQAPASDESRQKVPLATAAVREHLQQLFPDGIEGEESGATDLEKARQAVESIKARNQEQWWLVLSLFDAALKEAERRIPGSEATEIYVAASEVAQQGLNETQKATAPGKFDRATQWMFILCLPFVPYFMWTLMRTRRKVYELDDDGSFRHPDGTWAKEDIADIDMKKWMSKSIAALVHSDGSRVKLDDYVYKNADLIVGAVASEKYPEEWDEQAKPRTEDEEEEPEPLAPEDEDFEYEESGESEYDEEPTEEVESQQEPRKGG